MLKKIFNKEVLLYIIRLIVFLFLVKRFCCENIPSNNSIASILIAILGIMYFVLISTTYSIFRVGANLDDAFGVLVTLAMLFDIITYYIIALYLFSKITGIFKKIDNLRWYFKLSILILIYSLICIIYPLKFELLGLKFDEPIIPGFIVAFCIFPTYLLYLFFGFLSKKFTLFQKIGYYSSIEFWKSLISK